MQIDEHRIRPAARHIFTIGRDLVQNSFAAIVELVKNAYDADSPDVTISIAVSGMGYKIIIEDHGHGMNYDSVINKWLVPSVNDKLTTNTSPSGRRSMQGRKGIGRFSASLLGNDLLLETTVSDGNTTSVYLQWDKFEGAEFLSDVPILVEQTHSNRIMGTKLTIVANSTHNGKWGASEIKSLEKELMKLVPPQKDNIKIDLIPELDFEISLVTLGIEDDYSAPIKRTIRSLPLTDYFDYQIYGFIDPSGTSSIFYKNMKSESSEVESIEISNDSTDCGKIGLDIRVFDRDKDDIDNLINKALSTSSVAKFGKLEARRLLDDYSGIGVYRNGFRIRPLGDPQHDWLDLNRRRVQNPSKHISTNQVIGFISIESEEKSKLEEKSARDGIKDSHSFNRLKVLIMRVIGELENRRFTFRRKIGASRKPSTIEDKLIRIFDFSTLKTSVNDELSKISATPSTKLAIIDLIDRQEKQGEAAADDLRKAIGIYQGQATMGKIINIVLHEGRKPIGFFRNQPEKISYYRNLLNSDQHLDAISGIQRSADGLISHSQTLVDLFRRIDPLAAGRRGSRSQYNVRIAVDKALAVFEQELLDHKIVAEVDVGHEISLMGWEIDMIIILTNLLDNSIYWMLNGLIKADKKISISSKNNPSGQFHLTYSDTGPGINPDYLENGIIFEPEFSTKPSGTGLGLAIAGEAAKRNNLSLKAIENNSGALFIIEKQDGELSA